MVDRRRSGFTLVELSLVMAFFSVLLIGVLTLTIHIGKLYTKGMTNKSLNTVGRDVTDVLRRDFAAANAQDVQVIGERGAIGMQHGRICLGNVSYVWNTVGLLNAAPSVTRVTMGGTRAKLVRVIDMARSYCTPSGGNYPMTVGAADTAVDLLSDDEASGKRDFAVYHMVVTPAAVSAGDGMYRIQFTLGTYDPNTTQVIGSDNTCKPPTDAAANFEYCSVGDFDMYVRAGGVKE